MVLFGLASLQPCFEGIYSARLQTRLETKSRATKGARLRLKTYVIRNWGQQLSQVIIFSSFRGYIVPAAAIAAGIVYHFIKAQMDVTFFSISVLFYSVSGALALLYFYLGTYFDSRKEKNDFFFIPMRYYSGVVVAAIALDFFLPFIER